MRCSSHVLNIEMDRQNGILLEDRLCAFCENNGIVVIENEYHCFLHCRRYNTIREKYLKKHLVLYNVNSYSNFIVVRAHFSKRCILKVCKAFLSRICHVVVFKQFGYADSKSAPCQALFLVSPFQNCKTKWPPK